MKTVALSLLLASSVCLESTSLAGMSSENHVYDKAEYHDETIQKYGLSEDHACHHTVIFLRWLIENHLISEEFEREQKDRLSLCRAGKVSALDIYNDWDRCLVSDQLSPRGNAFAMHYFDFEKGRYVHGYIAALRGGLPSEFHIKLTEGNYQTMKVIIDKAYATWKTQQK